MAKKAGAVSRWSYIRVTSEINRLRGTPSFNGAYDAGHGWAQYFTRSGRLASGFVQVAKYVRTKGWPDSEVTVSRTL